MDINKGKTKLVAEIYTSIPLNKADYGNIEQAVHHVIPDVTEFIYHLDKKMLGGIRVKCEDWMIDLSITSELKTLANAIKG